MSIRLLVLLAIATMCFESAAAQSGFVAWKTPGNVCIPVDSTTRFDRHKVGIASVQHAPNNVQRIILNCPIEFSFEFDRRTQDWSLGLTYQDSTGANRSALVRARLYRMAVGSATPALVAAVNSDSSPLTTLDTVDRPFTHVFEPERNNYWLRVELDRSSTSEVVVFHGASMVGHRPDEPTPIPPPPPS